MVYAVHWGAETNLYADRIRHEATPTESTSTVEPGPSPLSDLVTKLYVAHNSGEVPLMVDDGRPDVDLTVDSEALDQARFRREALGSAAETLEEFLARPGSDPRWSRRVADAMQGLGAAFDGHRAEVEGDDGLLLQLQQDAPRLSGKIRGMEDEHVTIGLAIDDAARLISSCGGDCGTEAVAAIREAAVDVLRAISLHRQKGADLVYEAYSVDIGGG